MIASVSNAVFTEQRTAREEIEGDPQTDLRRIVDEVQALRREIAEPKKRPR